MNGLCGSLHAKLQLVVGRDALVGRSAGIAAIVRNVAVILVRVIGHNRREQFVDHKRLAGVPARVRVCVCFVPSCGQRSRELGLFFVWFLMRLERIAKARVGGAKLRTNCETKEKERTHFRF